MIKSTRLLRLSLPAGVAYTRDSGQCGMWISSFIIRSTERVSALLFLMLIRELTLFPNFPTTYHYTSKTPYVAIDERGLVRSIHLFLFSCVH